MPVGENVFERAEGCRRRLYPLVNVGLRAEGKVHDGTQVPKLFREVDKTRRCSAGVEDVETRSVRGIQLEHKHKLRQTYPVWLVPAKNKMSPKTMHLSDENLQ